MFPELDLSRLTLNGDRTPELKDFCWKLPLPT